MICLITTICVAVSGYFAKKKHNAENRLRHVERIYGGDFLLAFSSLLACVALADDRMTADEIAAVERMFSGMGLTEAERAMCVGNFMMAQRKAHDAKKSAAAVAGQLNRAACAFLYGLLWKIAKADGEVAEAEKELLKGIGATLGLGDGDPGTLPPCSRKSLEDAGVPPSLARLAEGMV